MDLFTCLTNKQKYSNNNFARTNVNNMHNKQLVYIYIDFAKTFSYKCIHQTADPCDIKGKTEQAPVVQLQLSRVQTTSGSVRILPVVCEDDTRFS